MRLLRTMIFTVVSLLLVISALAQDPNVKNFTKDGLSFGYPNGWSIVDESNSDAQQLTLHRDDSEAMVKIFVHRGKVNSPEKMAQAKSKLIDPYIEFTANQFVQMGAKPDRIPTSIEIGGSASDGLRIQAVIGGESGEAAIYWNAIGERLVVLTFFGPDKARKKAAPTWDIVRNSLKVEPPPQPKATPSPVRKKP